MARSMTQFGLLMILVCTSNANAIVVVSRQGEHAHKSNSSIRFP